MFVFGIVLLIVWLAATLLINGALKDRKKPLFSWQVITWGAIGLIAFSLFFGSMRVVPTGHTGIVTTFGKVHAETMDSGINFTAPWNKVVKMDNRNQKATMTLSCFSSDIQEVAVSFAVNYQISKENASNIYKTIGSNYVDTVMAPKIQETVKGVIAQYNAEKLIELRATLSEETQSILKDKLAEYDIEVITTSIENIDFTDEFTNAVEAKQVAEQNKLRATTEQEQANIEAEAAAKREVIAAQAKADASILAAEADAKVQQIGADAAEYAGKREAAVLQNIGEQMSKYPGLVKYYYYQNWDGKLPATIMGGDTDVLLEIDK